MVINLDVVELMLSVLSSGDGTPSVRNPRTTSSLIVIQE